MPYTLSFEDRDGWLHASTSGSVRNCFELFEKAHSIVSAAMSRNISRVLVDDRVVSMQIDAHDASLLADSMEDAGLQARGLRIACIHAPEYSTVYRLFETGHQSRSLNFRVFSDKAAALEWVLAD